MIHHVTKPAVTIRDDDAHRERAARRNVRRRCKLHVVLAGIGRGEQQQLTADRAICVSDWDDIAEGNVLDDLARGTGTADTASLRVDQRRGQRQRSGVRSDQH